MSEVDNNLRDRKRCWLKTFVVLLGILVPIGLYVVIFPVRANFREVVPGKVYRSAQPSWSELEKWVDKYDIKTVINLRGDKENVIADERKVLAGLGVEMKTIRLSSKRLPARYMLVDLIELIESSELPVLIHCKSGIDRGGTASALAAMSIGKYDYEKAVWESYVPPGPWKRKKYKRRSYFHDYLHVSDLFKFYESYCLRNNLEFNDWEQFKHWAASNESLPKEEPK